jgi:predicted NAD/FAD-binding protein
MKIAIIGSGISGIMAALRLHEAGHSVTIYEADDHIGGHAYTIKTPIDRTDYAWHELGVALLVPETIHKKVAACIQRLGIPLEPISLTFSFENDRFNGTTEVYHRLPEFLKNLLIFSSFHWTSKEMSLTAKAKYLLKFVQLEKLQKQIAEQSLYKEMNFREFIQCFPKYKQVFDELLCPQLLCWWGISKEHALECSVSILFNSFNKIKGTTRYILPNGWEHFIKMLAKPILHNIHLQSRVSSVLRIQDKVQVVCNAKKEEYDAAVLAVPPNVALELLHSPTNEEQKILRSFTTSTTEIFVHQDSSWMPKKQKKALINLIQDSRGEYCTYWSGKLHPKQPNIFISWGNQIQEIPKNIILKKKWLRTLPTTAYLSACQKIDDLQGEGNIWYCGAHVHSLEKDSTPSLCHENSFRSGEAVAEKLMQKRRIKNVS